MNLWEAPPCKAEPEATKVKDMASHSSSSSDRSYIYTVRVMQASEIICQTIKNNDGAIN